MTAFPGLERLKNYFLDLAPPQSVFQITPRYVSGLCVSPKEGKISGSSFVPLPAGVLKPSLDRTNLEDPAELERRVEEAFDKLGVSDGTAALLLPEACVRVFILGLADVPASRKEREEIIRWRLGKLMPHLPEDIRLAYERRPSGSAERIVAALARKAVIQEYEGLFGRLRVKVGTVTVPSLSLLNLFGGRVEEDVLLVNIEEDSLSLLVLSGSEVILHRQKTFSPEGPSGEAGDARLESLLQEVDNTIHFVEDRERKKLRSLWVRAGLVCGRETLLDGLRRRLDLPLKTVDSLVPGEMSPDDKTLLAPLAGQVV